MNLINRIQKNTKGFSKAIIRFPLTTVFLLVAAILNAMMIDNYNLNYENYLLALALGTLISVVFQLSYERYYTKFNERIISIVITIIITLVYYFLFLKESNIGSEIGIKTMVIMFALFIAILWVPSIKSVVTFNETFMAGFKAFFTSLFYSAVIMLGLVLIFAATDTLLFDVSEDIYAHTANIVFVLFSSLYFLSLIPYYPGKKDFDEGQLLVNEMLDEIEKPTSTPKFLEILISYILIPLASIFTLILLIYIVINITGSFWKDDLLEVMLVSYIVVVIIIYILSSRLDNNFAVGFRKVFPKILVFIVLFQTVNSIMRIGIRGLTYGRYYVILFGIFALISGVMFSIRSVEKNGIVPMVLIICIGISVFPYIDAFSISKRSQISVFENTLKDNDMLVNGVIIPNSDLDDSSKETIIESLQYLYSLDYVKDIEWLDEDFEYYNDFEDVFGFSQYDIPTRYDNSIDLYTDLDTALDISGYDFFIQTYLNYAYNEDYSSNNNSYEINYEGNIYNLVIEDTEKDLLISVVNQDDKALIEITANDLINKYMNNEYNNNLTISEAETVYENSEVSVKIIIQNLFIYDIEDDYSVNGSVYIMVKLK